MSKELKMIKPKKKKIVIAIGSVAILLCILYFVLVNFLVSAALVLSFMEKLEAFERITEESYAAQVQTTDVKTNRQTALKETKEWLETVEDQGQCQKLSVVTEDGYTLIAEEFFTEESSHKWVLLLHGYTGWKEEMYPFACWYHGQGYHVLAPDLRCQGESEGDYIGMVWTSCISADRYCLPCPKNAGWIRSERGLGN